MGRPANPPPRPIAAPRFKGQGCSPDRLWCSRGEVDGLIDRGGPPKKVRDPFLAPVGQLPPAVLDCACSPFCLHFLSHRNTCVEPLSCGLIPWYIPKGHFQVRSSYIYRPGWVVLHNQRWELNGIILNRCHYILNYFVWFSNFKQHRKNIITMSKE